MHGETVKISENLLTTHYNVFTYGRPVLLKSQLTLISIWIYFFL
jgi:hypothetical protein